MCARNSKPGRNAGAGDGWRRYEVEGFEILVGKGARENDRLTFHVASPHDLWLHASGYAGSHVVIRYPENGATVPREVIERAAELAAYHSKARTSRGKVEVHLCRVADVRKPRGFPPGKVELRRWEGLKVYARDPLQQSEPGRPPTG